ncbi:ankyrin repeat-containing domain protein [Phaeosphaeria sp. MPI-PUGE-AT-0046c]|nr:ankyrin repeat-containing domain protein [Phaeosphaeria sp. MPI-PUGE-AT-0046c]
MFELAETIAIYTVVHAVASERVTILPNDNYKMRKLKSKMRECYVELHKCLIFATTQITLSIYGDWQFVKNVMKHYDWEGQIKELKKHNERCTECRNEMVARQHDPEFIQPDQKTLMGPAPRNPLHLAVAFGVPDEVTRLVQTKEYPINALTPRKWTAAHLAAREDNTAILKTLLLAPGLDLRIKNIDGHIPLHVAALHNQAENARFLLRRDYESRSLCDDKGRTACTIAASNGYVGVLAVLWEMGQDFNETKSTNRWSALHLAAEQGHLETVQFLLKYGANKDARLKDGHRKGYTAKQIAMLEKKLDVAEIL